MVVDEWVSHIVLPTSLLGLSMHRCLSLSSDAPSHTQHKKQTFEWSKFPETQILVLVLQFYRIFQQNAKKKRKTKAKTKEDHQISNSNFQRGFNTCYTFAWIEYVTFISLVLLQRALFVIFILSNTNPFFSFVKFCLILLLCDYIVSRSNLIPEFLRSIQLNFQTPTFVGFWKSWAITKFGTSDTLLFLLI